jgi:hypothetical protein
MNNVARKFALKDEFFRSTTWDEDKQQWCVEIFGGRGRIFFPTLRDATESLREARESVMETP